jgi:hypothetical protein
MNKRILLVIALLAFVCQFANAQTTTGRLTGVVKDQAGALLPNAQVVITDARTGAMRIIQTNSEGVYLAVSLRPSEYKISATAPTFAVAEVRNVVLAVGQEDTHDFVLSPAGTQTVVTVDAGSSSVLDTSSPTIGANVGNREIQNLPINGRQISQLYLLVPGATNSGSGTFDNIRFSGRAVEENIIRLDGVEASTLISASPGNLNGEMTSLFRLQQSLEAVQEFRIDSSVYPAELGTGTGGQISFVTKSGSNQLHGSMFEYARNNYFDARNTPNQTGNTSFHLNQFGGSLGGPLAKNKVFFFGNYEGLRQRWAAPYSQATLSNWAKSSAYVPNPIFGTRSSAVTALFAAFPADPFDFNTEQANNTLQQKVTMVGTNSIIEDFGAIRFDYRINDRFQMYARYNRDQGTSVQIQDASLSKFGQVEVPQNGVLSLNQIWSPTVLNETKFGFNGAKMRVQGFAGPSPNADISKARIAVAGLTNVGSLISLSSSFNGIGAPYTAQSLSFIDNLSMVNQNHSYKFGVEIRPLQMYNNQIGGTTYTYNSIDQFLTNAPSQIQFYGDLSDPSPFTGLSGNALMKQAYYIGYAQDSWKVRPNLTLSYGMRYEYYSPLHEVRNKNVFFDMNAGTIYPKYTGNWFNSSTTNFGPRLGLTWSPLFGKGHTVIRVGGGMFYGPGQTEDQVQPEANDRVQRTFTSGKVYPISPQTDVYQGYDINSPTLGYQPRAYSPTYKIPERITSYSMSVQQELPGNFQVMVGYVGSMGRNLFLRSITNLITGVTMNGATGVGTAVRQFGGRFAEIDYKTSGGTDAYNALQSSLQRRFRSGLSMGMQYTWAKELGTSSGSNEAATAQEPYSYGPSAFAAEYGRGTFDIRHSMNVTALYDLPFGHGRSYSLNGIADTLAGGWHLGGTMNFRTGLPIDVLITRPDLAYVGNTGTPVAGQVLASPVVTAGVVQTTPVVNVPGGGNSRNVRRPNIVPGVNPYLKSGRQWLNPAAFTAPAPGTFGNARRNNYTGPNLAQLDATLSKTLNLGEKLNFEFHADVYNVLNHPNWASPGTVRLNQLLTPGVPYTTATAGSGTWGVLSGTVGNQVGIGANRQIQLSLRANF